MIVSKERYSGIWHSREGGEPHESTQITDRVHRIAADVSFLMRRLIRPQTYSQILKEIRDAKQWTEIDQKLLNRSRKRNGDFFFVQIGANDGVRGDPIRKHVISEKWKGVLVEPVPHYFAELQRNYSSNRDLQFVNAAISHRDGTATMYAAVPQPNGTPNPMKSVSSLDRKIIEKHRWMAGDDMDRLIKPIEIATMQLPTLFQECDVPAVDLLLVDTEGHDKVILDQLDLTSDRRPHFVLYEHAHLPEAEQAELQSRFSSNGYRLNLLRRDAFVESIL